MEKVVWSRRRTGESNNNNNRLFDLPCSGKKLNSRNGVRDTLPPYTCGTFARRAVLKYYLRNKIGGAMQNNDGAKQKVVDVVKAMMNETLKAWELDANYLCTCKNGTTTAWECCTEQKQCSIEPCACPSGYEVNASVACCTKEGVCGGLAGNGLMQAFSYIDGATVASEFLRELGGYMQNDIWTQKEPWLEYDVTGKETYKQSWEDSRTTVIDAGLFDTTGPIVTYDEMNYPFKNTIWKQCAGLLQQVMWTMPVDGKTGKPRMSGKQYDPMSKSSNTVNITYTEEFIQSLTLQAYKSSPLYWHYNARYTPSDSQVCRRNFEHTPASNVFFNVGTRKAIAMGFSSMTLGGLGGADCYCGWWGSQKGSCKIPATLCETLVQIVGLRRVCVDQMQTYNSSDHVEVLEALEVLMERQPNTVYRCPLLQISEHWGFLGSDGLPMANATNEILTEGVGGFRKGNTEWLFDEQVNIINQKTRIDPTETSAKNAALQCQKSLDPSIADHFVDDLFPAAQGVRQSMPQTYCTRYGIELARLTVYKAAHLDAAAGQQEGMVDKWRMRCQFKLEELAVCNLHHVMKSYSVAHESDDHCPFIVQAPLSTIDKIFYSVTPGCLLVVWNTQGGLLDGIFDPCICMEQNAASATATMSTCSGEFRGTSPGSGLYVRNNFAIPGGLVQSCMMQGLQDIVGETVIPGETDAEIPIGSGSFASLMDKNQRNLKINTQQEEERNSHWTVHKRIQDADFIHDWWPDEWRFPAGYHVTPGCSRLGDQHWKTFDSSWRWNSDLKKMIFSNDEANDPFLKRNAFGASGVCRTNNYGMPVSVLNTMVVCTRENEDAKADPMVPLNTARTMPWVDGKEFCAARSDSTPWSVDQQVNPPRQWSVGTLQQQVTGLSPLDTTEWGPGCGPYDILTCKYNDDCALGLECIKSMSAVVGVCAKKAPNVFECTEHSHCLNDKMCAGDGKCVDGVWKVTNSLGQDISFRTHSQICKTGVQADTWGTSVAENVPDILRSSGMCSFRSWYENRKMAEANQCTNKGSCSGFRGVFPWNFTDRVSTNSAFDDEVLKVKVHPCDKEFQYVDGFKSCTPYQSSVGVFNSNGIRLDPPGPEGFPTDSRTRTYRLDKSLPIVSLTQGQQTKGFTGIPETYGTLLMGRVDSKIKPCIQVNACGLQSDFKVNGIKINNRMVLDNGNAREYSVVDMIKCGSFGSLISSLTTEVCQFDYAVVPLAYVYRNTPIGSARLDSLKSGTYVPGKLAEVFADLFSLPDLYITTYIGGRPTTLTDYMDMTEKFNQLYTLINQIPKPVYDDSGGGAGTPKQIYYLTKRGAYEVPFMWWYKCAWLTGLGMGSYEISNSECPATTTASGIWLQSANIFPPHDPRLVNLMGAAAPESMTTDSGTLQSLLQRSLGVISRRAFDSIRDQFKSNRDSWLRKIMVILGRIIKKCYYKKVFVPDFAARSNEYQMAWVRGYTGGGFNLNIDYKETNNNNTVVCSMRDCLRSEYSAISSVQIPGGFGDMLIQNLILAAVQVDGAKKLSDQASVSTSNTNAGYIFIPGLVTSEIAQNDAALKTSYPVNSDGCNYPITADSRHTEPVRCVCSEWGTCSTEMQNDILMKGRIPIPLVNVDSSLNLNGMGAVQVCGGKFPSSITGLKEECFTDPGSLVVGSSSYAGLTDVTVPIGVSLEAFHQDSWDCALFTCVDTNNPYHGKVKSIDQDFTSTTVTEKVVMTEISYDQKTFLSKSLPWTSQADEDFDMEIYNPINHLKYCKNSNDNDRNACDEYGINKHTYCQNSEQWGYNPSEDTVRPFREVTESYSHRLTMYTFEYFINGEKVAGLETHPCATESSIESGSSSSSSDTLDILWGVINSGKSKSWESAVSLMDSYNGYRSERETVGHLCNMSGIDGLLPEAMSLFKITEPRSSKLVLNGPIASKHGINSMQNVVDRITNIIYESESHINPEDGFCMSATCRFDDEVTNKRGYAQMIKEYETDDVEMQNFCTSRKSDSHYGCIMYPAEAVGREKECYRYPDKFKQIWCDGKNDPFSCTWSHYYRCLIDSENDKCFNDNTDADISMDANTKKFRDMAPTGKKMEFVLKKTTPACTAGPTMQCKLKDEPVSLNADMKPGFCPSTSESPTQRSRLYRQMRASTSTTAAMLNTQIERIAVVPDTYTFNTDEVDHVLLSLDTVYFCSLSTAPTVCPDNKSPIKVRGNRWICPSCANNEILIEVRNNLWRCGQCPTVSDTFCTGPHNCVMETPGMDPYTLNTLDGWDNLTTRERAFLTTANATIDVAISSVRWLVNQTMRMAISGIGLAYDVPEFMKTYIGPDFEYSPLNVISYSNSMDKRAPTCTETGIMPVTTNCSFDGNRRSLRDFINSTKAGYKVQDGIIIQDGKTLVWNVLKSQMTSQNIPGWLAVRNKTGMFWEDLFDDKWCKSGTMEDNVCYITTNGLKLDIKILNPGLLGDFEPLEGCDTTIINGQRVVNAICVTCPAPTASDRKKDLSQTEGGGEMSCPEYYETVSGVSSNQAADSNLCGKAPLYESSCANIQGMLGQATNTYDSPSSVYTRIPWKGGLQSGIRENLLFRGGSPTVGSVSNLILKPTDIGGHCLKMEIKQPLNTDTPVMSIVEVPLSSYTGYLSSMPVTDRTKLAWMNIDYARETDSIRTLYPNSVCATWDCPLRRRAFYTGRKQNKNNLFRPVIPDPLRAHVLFGSRVHPTQKASPIPETTTSGQVSTLGFYYTSNGFCACMLPPCTTCKSDEEALTGTWQTSKATPSGCTKQLDWPYLGGTLRDDASYQGSVDQTTTCGILDRLPVFKYRYINNRFLTISTKTTLDVGGVCHMGWPISTPIPPGCHIVPKTSSYTCPASNRGILTDVKRLAAKTVDQLLQYRLRPSLKECDPTPKYATTNGDVKPEVSYGVLTRLETSRMLAIDLRRKLCGNGSVCTPSETWKLDTFWDEIYMKNFQQPPGGDGANQTLWENPWVACIQHQENQTQTCEGRIDRDAWIKGNRAELCLKIITNTSTANKLAQPINVCDLDQDMDMFCRTVQDGRYRVFEANCLFSEQCRQKLFFYQPSTYSISNSQFVRSTVQQFYESTVKGSCVPDLDTAKAIKENAANLEHCAALTLATLADCIQIVRVIIDSLIEIVFYIGNLVLYVFEMLVVSDKPSLRSQIIQQINAVLTHIKNSFIQFINAFADLAYKILFGGPMGKWIMTLIIKVCEFLNWVFNNIVQPVICWVRTAMLFVLDGPARQIVEVLSDMSFQKLSHLKQGLMNARRAVADSLQCDRKNPLDCNITFRDDTPLITTLPMATRCWAGVEPGINSFACTAADTCLNNDFSKVICAACPKADFMIQFGCNTLTKLCSCNVFVTDTSFCSSHEECTMESDEVECEFVDSYLEPSYGHIPCKQCPKPMCLITDGSGVGKCTCLLRPIPNQGCVGLGDRVSPSASSLCLVVTAGGGQGSSSTYTQMYRTLASVPCMLLNQATSYCMQVYTSAITSIPMVVGLSLLKTFGRRLLQINGSMMLNVSPLGQFISNASAWDGIGEPCNSLVAANASGMGIIEKYTLGECWRWRDVGAQLISEANMTNIRATFLVSWQDLLHAMLEDGAVPEILRKLPQVLNSIFIHTEAAQPIYVTLLYWSSYLPDEVWSNHSILTYLKNLTGRSTAQKAEEGGNNNNAKNKRRLLLEVNDDEKGDDHDQIRLQKITKRWNDGPYGWLPNNQIYWNLPDGHQKDDNKYDQQTKRRLLSSTTQQEEDFNFVQNAESTVVDITPSSETVYEWSQGPYSWPPNFKYWKGKDSCAVVSTAINVVKNGLDITMKFYQSPSPEPKRVEIWPMLPFNNVINLQFSMPNTSELGQVMLQYADQMMNKTYIDDFLDNAPYAAVIKSLIQCNFTKIQTCEGRYDLTWSIIHVVVLLLVVGFIGRLLEIPYIEPILFVFFIPLVMYYCYGYAITCSPLVPVCALRDVIALLEAIIPEKIEWPAALVTAAGCRDVSCMRSCVDEPDIGFASWHDHLAWLMCETNAEWCNAISKSLASDDPLRRALKNKYFPGNDPGSTRAARRICFTVTLVNSAPPFLALLLLLWLLPSFVGVLTSGVQFMLNTLIAFVIFVHHESG